VAADARRVTPAPKRLALRRADQCAACGQELAVGTVANWHRELRQVTCLSCPAARPKVVEGTAGASALREYARRHERREARARERFGRLGVWLTSDPTSTTVWKQGAAGEVRTADRLRKHLGGSGVRLLHDRRIPGRGSANIDHLAVGPGGVTVIDTKTHRGSVRVERVGGLFSPRGEVLRVGGRDQTKLIDGVLRQVSDVEAALARVGHADVGVRGALCLAKPDGLPRFRSLIVGDVLVDGPRAVGKLAGRPGAVAPAMVAAVWEALDLAFPPA
jgi:hypothetical protein